MLQCGLMTASSYFVELDMSLGFGVAADWSADYLLPAHHAVVKCLLDTRVIKRHRRYLMLTLRPLPWQRVPRTQCDMNA